MALTRAPAGCYDRATVDFGAVEIVTAGGAPIRLTDDAGEHDLLDLRQGDTAALATLDVEPGRYRRLRLAVDGGTLELAEGLRFADGTTTRDLFASGEEGRIEVDLARVDGAGGPGLDIRPGRTRLVVDFDIGQRFVVRGAPGAGRQMCHHSNTSVTFVYRVTVYPHHLSIGPFAMQEPEGGTWPRKRSPNRRPTAS